MLSSFSMKQTSFFTVQNWNKAFVPEKGKRKIKRPLSTKNPIHLILRSSKQDLRKNEREVIQNWNRLARKFGVRTYRVVVASDHLHALVRLHSQRLYNQFIQALTGMLSKRLQVKWRNRPTTRLAQWGKDFRRLKQYLELNFLEANHILEYRPKRTRDLPDWIKL